MSQCFRCGAEFSSTDASCPQCGHARDERDPYQPTEAVVSPEEVSDRQAIRSTGYGFSLTVEGVLGSSFRIWSMLLGKLVLIQVFQFVAIGVFIGLLLLGGFKQLLGSDSSGVSMSFVITFVVGLLLVIPISINTLGGAFLLIENHVAGDRNLGVFDAFVEAFGFFGRYVLLSAMVFAVYGLLFGIGGMVFAVLDTAGGLLFSLGAAVFLIYFLTIICVAWPMIAVENVGVVDSVGRSRDLLRGRFWRLFGILCLMMFIFIAFGVGGGILGLIPILGQLAGLALNLILTPLAYVFLFVLYGALKDLGVSA